MKDHRDGHGQKAELDLGGSYFRPPSAVPIRTLPSAPLGVRWSNSSSVGIRQASLGHITFGVRHGMVRGLTTLCRCSSFT